jgi:hypothetical protein
MDFASLFKSTLLKLAAIVVAAGIWLPCMHLLYKPNAADFRSPDGTAPKARMLAARHLDIWSTPDRRRVELHPAGNYIRLWRMRRPRR